MKYILTEAELLADRREQFVAGVAWARAEAGDYREHQVAALGEPSEEDLRALLADMHRAWTTAMGYARTPVADVEWKEGWRREALAAWRWCRARFGAQAVPAPTNTEAAEIAVRLPDADVSREHIQSSLADVAVYVRRAAEAPGASVEQIAQAIHRYTNAVAARAQPAPAPDPRAVEMAKRLDAVDFKHWELCAQPGTEEREKRALACDAAAFVRRAAEAPIRNVATPADLQHIIGAFATHAEAMAASARQWAAARDGEKS